MLKTRLIASLILKNRWVVQSIGFCKYLPVGTLEISVEFLNKWGIDEIVILDIDATTENRPPNFDLISSAAKYSQVPITVGGGIKNMSHIEEAISVGADKIVLNTAFIENPEIVWQAANKFGSQCVVVSIDIIENEKFGYSVFSRNASIPVGMNLLESINSAQKSGAGEILLNSVNRDGFKKGYDLELFKYVRNITNIPVILCGGVGKPSHFIDAVNAGATAVAAGNYFHFSEHSVITTKNILRRNNIDVRLDTYVKYEKAVFEKDTCRLHMYDEDILDKIRFIYIPKEII